MLYLVINLLLFLVNPDILIEYAYLYGSNKIVNGLLALDEATMLSTSKMPHNLHEGVVIATTYIRRMSKNYLTTVKALELMTEKSSNYIFRGDEPGSAKARIMMKNILRFGGKNTFLYKYYIFKEVLKLRKEFSLNEIKNILLDENNKINKIYKKYLKKFNTYNPRTIVKNINSTPSENIKMRQDSFKIKNTDKLKKIYKKF